MLGWPGKKTRRRKLLRRPVEAEWTPFLLRNVAQFAQLYTEQRSRLLDHARLFVAEKRFEAALGYQITQEMRVTIAAQACLLLLAEDPIRTRYFPRIRSIIVYPNTYSAPVKSTGPAGVVTEGRNWRAGEAWHGVGSGVDGYIVLSWADVRRGGANAHDGRNVVLHEFAHALDGEFGSVEGAPMLKDKAEYRAWAQVFQREFDVLRAAAAHGEPTLLNKYGAQSPAEFFAVATEAYFEQPRQMKQMHPELFGQLKRYYGWDPGGGGLG
ncbi:MAG: zinc-dependent peptidase [Phycisphaerales bacterium]|nr:zinc-dependent peptidase [Phycisphaerales bacterium]